MAVTVRIPPPLRKADRRAGRPSPPKESGTLAQLIDVLEGMHPGLKERICDETGALRRFVNVYVNGEDVRFMSGLATEVAADTEVSIVPAVAGGC